MDLNLLLPQVCETTEKAGAFINEHFGNVAEKDIEHKAMNSLVSYVDTTAEEIIVEDLKNLLPGAGFLTEEETISQVKQRIRWIIDPLDGTTNFLQGLPFFSVSIALEVDNEIVLGVVYEVNRKECFYASKGQGAFLNGLQISVSQLSDLKDAVVATGFPYHDFNLQQQYLSVLSVMMRETRGIRRFGSAALDLCYVACGRFDGFFEYGLNPWDVAAGSIIVTEAGGIMSDFSGGTTFTNGKEIIASNPHIYSPFYNMITKDLCKVS